MSNGNTWLSFKFPPAAQKGLHKCFQQFAQCDIDLIDQKTMHMTAAFLGKSLRGKQVTLLQDTNTFLHDSVEAMPAGVQLQFDRFDYLPLGAKKKKLLVAIFKDHAKLNKWNVGLRRELKDRGLCTYDDPLLAHVTVGRVQGASLPTEKQLTKSKPPPTLPVLGMYLCGQQNKHLDEVFER